MLRKTLVILICCSFLFTGCGGLGGSLPGDNVGKNPSQTQDHVGEEGDQQITSVIIKDSEGKEIKLPKNPRIVSLYGSYAQAYTLSGGTLVGVTEDAIEDQGLTLTENMTVVGSVKEPNAELILSLAPDLVILSLDIAAQQNMRRQLEGAGLTLANYRMDTFADYAFMMEQFCKLTGREDLYHQNVTRVEAQIQSVKETVLPHVTPTNKPKVLLIRAFSTGMKAKTDDELAGVILKELGCHNIADDHPSMLEDLSIEQVILSDPDYIFVTTMGSESKALDFLNAQIAANPAWQGLAAVQKDRCEILPKALYHYKPNHRWGESYEYLAEILYPDLFEK